MKKKFEIMSDFDVFDFDNFDDDVVSVDNHHSSDKSLSESDDVEVVHVVEESESDDDGFPPHPDDEESDHTDTPLPVHPIAVDVDFYNMSIYLVAYCEQQVCLSSCVEYSITYIFFVIGWQCKIDNK